MRAKPRKGFGERLAALRSNRGLRQEDVARDLGVTLGTISRWERGENLPHAEQIKAIVQYFDTTADHLVMGTPLETLKSTPEFQKFLATDYGRIARQRGWLNFLASAEYPAKPTVRIYKELVHALMRAYDEGDEA
jgi:transcriptional regulator with XRE-family HTH domain